LQEFDYSRPIEIAKGIFWVGFNDQKTGLRCNPYLIVDNEEAVLIDGGSRPDFPQVMMKILKTGIAPDAISTLIYQHYDPDLCGSLPNLENIINNDSLKIYSAAENHMFIRHYSAESKIENLRSHNFEYQFKSGRTLKFVQTPYAHAAGSFVTFDVKTRVLFTSDIFGSYTKKWDLFQKSEEQCLKLDSCEKCNKTDAECPFSGIFAFHRTTFPSGHILRYALNEIATIDFAMIAPQHGSILDKEMGRALLKKLSNLDNVGIDRIFNKNNEKTDKSL
jgi:glyoxylase-like metal-dependent hydrolase (beta-lactamase superfamily II)